RVPALADAADHPGRAVRAGHEPVDQGGFADAGVADQGGDFAADSVEERFDVVVDAADFHGDFQGRELGGELRGVGQVGFGQAQDRPDAAGEGGDERAFHEAGARGRVGHGDDDEQQFRVGHDDALEGVVVVGGAAQDAGAVLQLHDARQRALVAGGVADDADAIADLDGGAAHFAGAHAGDHDARDGAVDDVRRRFILVEDDAPAAAVLGDHAAPFGVPVLRAVLGAGTGAAARADPDVGLVPLAVSAQGSISSSSSSSSSVTSSAISRPSISDQRMSKSGMVLPVVPMFSTRVPGTFSPMMAPAVAMRWSS